MWNMKALSLTVQKLWPRLKFSKCRSKVKVTKFGNDGNVLTQGIHLWNMKAISLMVHKLWSRLKFLKCRSKVMVKVKNFGTDKKILSQGICMWNMKALSLTVQKLWSRFKIVSVFKTYVKSHSQGHTVKKCGTDGKVMSQGIHMWNMKAVIVTVQKLWPRLKFLNATDKLTKGQTDRQAKN